MTKRKSLLTLFIVGLALLALPLAGSPARAALPGWHPIGIQGSSHCLDDATENIYKVQMWSCSGALEQNWTVSQSANPLYQTVGNERTGLCLTAPASLPGPVTMAVCTAGNPRQLWQASFYNGFHPNLSGAVEYQDSGYCLATSSVANGTVPEVAVCDFTDSYFLWSQR
jgi:hypothetical protein